MPSAEESLILLGSDPGAVQWEVVGEEGGPEFENDWNTPDNWASAIVGDPVSTGRAAPHYRKFSNYVILEGGTGGGTDDATAFTLPEGFRPQESATFSVPAFTLDGKFGFALLVVTSDGAVTVSSPHVFNRTAASDENPLLVPDESTYAVSFYGIGFTTTYGD